MNNKFSNYTYTDEPNIFTNRIKLDDILEDIKNIKPNKNLKNEIRTSIKILKRFKQSESAKWNSELLLTVQNSPAEISIPSNLQRKINFTEKFSLQKNFDLKEENSSEENGENLLQNDQNILNKNSMENLIEPKDVFMYESPSNRKKNKEIFMNNKKKVSSNKFQKINKDTINVFSQERLEMMNQFNNNNSKLRQIEHMNNINNNNLTEIPQNSSGKIYMKKFNSNSINLNSDDKVNFLSNDSIIKIYYDDLKAKESSIKDILSYSSTLFDQREYSKCVFVLQDYANSDYPTAFFYYYFCEYLLIKQEEEEDNLDDTDPMQKSAENKNLNKLLTAIEQSEYEIKEDPFASYLFGVILKDLDGKEEAKKYFINSLNKFPYLWSAWVELCSLLDQDDYGTIFSDIDDHWMKHFFFSNYLAERNLENEAITIGDALLQIFPNSFYLNNLIANCFYLIHEYEISQEYFEQLFSKDPYRFENIDIFSNILFIKENYCELANLAHRCFRFDKYRPETCCVIGNYYGLKGDHLKAIKYFKRATKLDNSFLPAWTLMGHEHLEMKNIPSAIECYRTATDINPNDFRAWYGLGQTYEIHQMFNHAVFYFLNAAKTKPNDSRMWTALGSCYDKLDKKLEAIKSYEKALNCKDKEGIALLRIGKLYESIGEEEKAAFCFKENVKLNSENESDSNEIMECYVFLARFYMKQESYESAFEFLTKLKDYKGPEKSEVELMLKKISTITTYSKNQDVYMDM